MNRDHSKTSIEPATVVSCVLEVEVLKLIEVSWPQSESKIDNSGNRMDSFTQTTSAGCKSFTDDISAEPAKRKEKTRFPITSAQPTFCHV